MSAALIRRLKRYFITQTLYPSDQIGYPVHERPFYIRPEDKDCESQSLPKRKVLSF